MDSLTQLTLGAAIGVAVMGRRTAAWKAALWGGVAGTLPDLDALLDHGDAVLNMVLHRADSHALLYLALAGWPMGWLIARLHGDRSHGPRWVLAMTLALTTHALLDWMTVYGTQLLRPFTDSAYGVGSMFIIDPAYTLPLLAGVVWALTPHKRGHQANAVALGLSTAYLCWSVLAQSWVTEQAQASLQRAGISADQVLVTPAPFNTVLWRVVAIDGTHYHEGFYSLLDRGRAIRFNAHPLGRDLMVAHANHPHVQRMARFTDGFFRMQWIDGDLWLTDLRMGQEPAYVFNFNLGRPWNGNTPLPAATQRSDRGDVAQALRWLWPRLLGADLPPLGTALSQGVSK